MGHHAYESRERRRAFQFAQLLHDESESVRPWKVSQGIFAAPPHTPQRTSIIVIKDWSGEATAEARFQRRCHRFGSNSVRLVVLRDDVAQPFTIFNEKALCGLGREVQTTGLLANDAVNKALTALRRFRALCRIQQVGRVYAIADRRLS